MNAASASVTWPQVVTALVAGAAFVLAGVSLGFQYFVHRTAGFRPEIQAYSGVIVGTPGPAVRVVSVDARNRGRSSGEVTNIAFQGVEVRPASWLIPRRFVPADGELLYPMRRLSGDLPGAVAGNGFTDWTFNYESIHEGAAACGYTYIRPIAVLGSGKRVRGKPLEVSREYQSPQP